MAITESGLYGLTIEKMMIDTLGESIEAADLVNLLLDDTHTPDFDLDDFHADLDGLISGGNYTDDTLVSPAVTLSSNVLTYDHGDALYDNGGSDDVTITDAMALLAHTTVSGSATDQLLYVLDFVTAASCTNSNFTVQINGSGAFTIAYTSS